MPVSSRFDYRTPADSSEVQQLGRILAQCFNSSPTDEPVYLSRIGNENVRILCDRGRIIGGLGRLQLGQWYGSARVPMVGVAAVGIAPEHRGQGAAIALMQSVLQELHAQKTPVSVLYSAAQPLYRKVGYEQAGTLCTWEIPTSSIEMRDNTRSLELVSLEVEQFAPLYHQQATRNNGNLDRNAVIWQGLLESQTESPAYAYRIGTAAQPEGYIIFRQQCRGGQCQILIKDWVLLTPAAVRTVWTFLASHRSQIDSIQWQSSPVDALTLMLPEQKTAKIRALSRWMMRIVEVKQALEKRGYPSNLEAELHLQITDSLLPQNTGNWILTVEKGSGTVTQGGRGDLQLDIGSLSPLYTGLFSADQLHWCDRLTGTADALSTATQMFACSLPWMPDFF